MKTLLQSILLLMIIPFSSNAQVLNFSNQVIISDSCNNAFDVVSADLNNDGNMDIISVSYDDNKVVWYENDGNEHFTEHVISDTTTHAATLFAIDINNDGNIDIISGSSYASKVVWYENNASASSWTEHIISSESEIIFSIFASDLDGDNDIDIVTTSFDNDILGWYENTDGNGTFSTRNVIDNNADGVTTVYVADFDGDNDNDIVAGCAYSDKVTWYRNDGAGNFVFAQDISTSSDYVKAVVAFDIDNDNDLDILVASSYDNRIAWFDNDGTGVFGLIHLITNSSAITDNPADVKAADIDNDGLVDVVSISNGDNKLAWYKNAGDYTFEPQQVISTNFNNLNALTLTDINKDGTVDFLTASVNDNKISLIKNNGCKIADYPFNNNVTDITNNGNNGDISSFPPTSSIDRFGNASSAYSFDGVDDIIEVVHSPIFIANKISYSLWFKTMNPDTATNQVLISKSLTGFNDGDFTIYINNGIIKASIENETQSYEITFEDIYVNSNWNHLVFTGEFGSYNLYLNGNHIGYKYTSIYQYNNTQSLCIGGETDVEYNSFFGDIDDVKVFACELGENEIDSLYHINGWKSIETCTVASYSFTDDGTDLSDNQYDATINNSNFTNGALNIGYNTSDYASLPNEVLNGINDFTISFWTRINEAHENACNQFISGANSSEDNEFGISYDGDTAIRIKIGDNAIFLDIPFNITVNRNYNIQVTRLDSLISLYVNGNLIGSNKLSDKALDIEAGGLIIGQEQDNLGGGFQLEQSLDGYLQDLQIYQCALQEETLDSIYHTGYWYQPNCKIASYLFNGNTNDETNNHFDGTTTSGHEPTLIEDRFGNSNSAYLFNGTDYIVCPSMPLLETFSISAWIKTPTSSNKEMFIEQHNGGTNEGFWFATNADSLQTDNNIIQTEILDEWTHVIYVADSGTEKIYKNGELILEQSAPVINHSGQNLYIGGEDFLASMFTGAIDDINIFKCVVDSQQIDSLYHVGGWFPNSNCQIINWQFNNSLADSSGNNLDGEPFIDDYYTSDRFGNLNSAFLSNDSSASIIASDYGLGIQYNMSISVWIKYDSLQNDSNIITMALDGAGNGFDMFNIVSLAIFNDTLCINYDTSSVGISFVGTTINTGIVIEPHLTYHLVLTKNSSLNEFSLYINNHYINSYAYIENQHYHNNEQLIIVNFPDEDLSFNGTIDDVIYFNCLIDEPTIDSLYHIGGWLGDCSNFGIDSVDVLDATCGLTTGFGEAFVSGGSGNYTYLWSNSDTLSSTDSLGAGTNYVLVTDAEYACSETYYFQTQNIGAPSIFTNISEVNCNGNNNGTISTSVIGGALPYIYNWSNGEHTTGIMNLFAGTYNITVIDNFGCIASQLIEITEPDELTLAFDTTSSTCGASNGSAIAIVTGGTGSYLYSWLSGTNEILGIPAGAYNLTVTDNNGCTISGSAMISDAAAPIITIDSIVSSSCSTSTGSVGISVSGVSGTEIFDWSNGANTEDLIDVASGSYTLTLHDGTCISMLDVFVPLTVPESQEICIVTVDSIIGANLIVWEKPISTEIDKYLIYRETSIPDEYVQIGNTPYNELGVYVDSMAYPWIRSYKYKISVIDNCGTESELSASHKTIHVNLNLGYLSNTINLIWDDYEGFTYSTFHVITYDAGIGWNEVAGSPLPTSLHSLTANVLPTSLMYAVTVEKPGNACLSTKTSGGPYNQSVSNIDEYSNGPVSINSTVNNINLDIFPNPANSMVQISSDYNIETIIITDINGQVVYSSIINSSTFTIDVSKLEKGMYFVSLLSENGKSVKKLVVE